MNVEKEKREAEKKQRDEERKIEEDRQKQLNDELRCATDTNNREAEETSKVSPEDAHRRDRTGSSGDNSIDQLLQYGWNLVFGGKCVRGKTR